MGHLAGQALGLQTKIEKRQCKITCRPEERLLRRGDLLESTLVNKVWTANNPSTLGSVPPTFGSSVLV